MHLCAELYSEIDTDAATNGLEMHNTFRAMYDAPPLQWNTSVARDAMLYSAKCVFEHSKDRKGQGENLCLGVSAFSQSLPSLHLTGD